MAFTFRFLRFGFCSFSGAASNSSKRSSCGTLNFEDEANNSSTCSFTLTLESAAPTLSAYPGSITVDCLSDVPGDQGITAEDDCDGSIALNFYQVDNAGDCPGNGSIQFSHFIKE